MTSEHKQHAERPRTEPVVRIALHYWDLYFQAHRAHRFGLRTVAREAFIATDMAAAWSATVVDEFARPCEILVPVAYYFENPLCRHAVDSYWTTDKDFPFRLVVHGSLENFLLRKLLQFDSNQWQYDLYHRALIATLRGEVFLPPVVQRRQSASARLLDAWPQIADEIGPIIFGRSQPSLGRLLHDLELVPDRLEGAAILGEHIAPLTDASGSFGANLLALSIQEELNSHWFEHFAEDLDAFLISRIPHLPCPKALADYALDYQVTYSALQRSGLLPFFGAASPGSIRVAVATESWTSVVECIIKSNSFYKRNPEKMEDPETPRNQSNVVNFGTIIGPVGNISTSQSSETGIDLQALRLLLRDVIVAIGSLPPSGSDYEPIRAELEEAESLPDAELERWGSTRLAVIVQNLSAVAQSAMPIADLVAKLKSMLGK